MAVLARRKVAVLLGVGAALTVCMLSATPRGTWSIALAAALALLPVAGTGATPHCVLPAAGWFSRGAAPEPAAREPNPATHGTTFAAPKLIGDTHD